MNFYVLLVFLYTVEAVKISLHKLQDFDFDKLNISCFKHELDYKNFLNGIYTYKLPTDNNANIPIVRLNEKNKEVTLGFREFNENGTVSTTKVKTINLTEEIFTVAYDDSANEGCEFVVNGYVNVSALGCFRPPATAIYPNETYQNVNESCLLFVVFQSKTTNVEVWTSLTIVNFLFNNGKKINTVSFDMSNFADEYYSHYDRLYINRITPYDLCLSYRHTDNKWYTLCSQNRVELPKLPNEGCLITKSNLNYWIVSGFITVNLYVIFTLFIIFLVFKHKYNRIRRMAEHISFIEDMGTEMM